MTHTADDEPFNTKVTEFPVASTPWGLWGTLVCFDRQLPQTSRGHHKDTLNAIRRFLLD